MGHRIRCARGCGLVVVMLLSASLSCAKAPGATGSGVRLVVTMQYNQPVKDNYHYFFLIRNEGDDIGRNGPVPVFFEPYGINGFAAPKSQGSGLDAFTDFVEYSLDQAPVFPSGYTLYHVTGGTQANVEQPATFVANGTPVAAQSPNGGRTLQFELDLAQIAPGANDVAPNPDTRPRYLQINFISTSTLPQNSAIHDRFFTTDAIGDQTGGSSAGSYITIDTTQIGKTYASNLSPGPDEPSDDEYPINDPQLDLVFWSVQIVKR